MKINIIDLFEDAILFKESLDSGSIYSDDSLASDLLIVPVELR